MAFRPRPMMFTCTACSWKKRTHPQSDALMPGDYFDKCPKCGAGVEMKRDDIFDLVLQLKRVLGL